MSAAKKKLLIVDNDPRSLRVLEVSLRQAGYSVTTASDGVDAIAKLESGVPDLIVSDTRLPRLDGYGLVRRIRGTPAWSQTPILFLANEKSVEDRIRGLEIGVEDFLTKPVFVRELNARVSLLLGRSKQNALSFRKETHAGGSDVRAPDVVGRTSDLALVDILQSFEVARRSGVVQLRDGAKEAQLVFRSGKIVDASCGDERGEDAAYRAMYWNDAAYEVRFGEVKVDPTIEISTHTLIMEGMRRVDEWWGLLERLPPPTTPLEVDQERVVENLSDLSDGATAVLRMVDGSRTLAEIVERAPGDPLETLATLSSLYDKGLVKANESLGPLETRNPTDVAPPASRLRRSPTVPPSSGPSVRAEASADNEGLETAGSQSFSPSGERVSRPPSNPTPAIADTPVDSQGQPLPINTLPVPPMFSDGASLDPDASTPAVRISDPGSVDESWRTPMMQRAAADASDSLAETVGSHLRDNPPPLDDDADRTRDVPSDSGPRPSGPSHLHQASVPHGHTFDEPNDPRETKEALGATEATEESAREPTAEHVQAPALVDDLAEAPRKASTPSLLPADDFEEVDESEGNPDEAFASHGPVHPPPRAPESLSDRSVPSIILRSLPPPYGPDFGQDAAAEDSMDDDDGVLPSARDRATFLIPRPGPPLWLYISAAAAVVLAALAYTSNRGPTRDLTRSAPAASAMPAAAKLGSVQGSSPESASKGAGDEGASEGDVGKGNGNGNGNGERAADESPSVDDSNGAWAQAPLAVPPLLAAPSEPVAETKPSREVEPEGTAKTEPSVAAAQEPAPPPAVEPPTPPTPVPPSVPPMASAAETAPTGPTASAAKDTPAPAARPDAPTWSGKDAKTLTKEALVALEQGRFREAARLARHATELNPGDADSWLTLGAAYDSLGYKAPAQGAFKSCVHNSRGARVEECRRLIVPE